MDDLKVELETRAKTMQQMLQDEGYGAKTPAWDDQAKTWDIRVNFEGMSMLIMLDQDDPLFVRVMLANFWDVKPEQMNSTLVALDVANKKAKGAKVYLNLARNYSIAAMEFLYNGTGMDGQMLVRSMNMVVNVAKVYVSAFKEQQDS